DEIPTVLEAFGQGSHAIKTAEPGTGLGLSIVQALINMHDGKFSLKSRPGEGTEVIVTLPRARIMNYSPDVIWVDPNDKDSGVPSGKARSA
ncbi:MAG: ATP-binding protein, partial [Pseudomonadota bacterium]|nr:ATP-binding protein [Pseudomonadota bacterium]